jgi:hypothetical protein
MWEKVRVILLLLLCVSLSGLLYAEDSDTLTSIDQALQEVNNIEQNQMHLKSLLIEREATIVEKDKYLSQMTLQFQNLNAYCLFLENENKINKTIWAILGTILIGETVYILGDRVFNLW